MMKTFAFMLTVLLLVTLPLASAQNETWPAHCVKPSATGCGAVCNFTCAQSPGTEVPMYVFSPDEVSGTCRREKMEYKGKPTAVVETDTTLGTCSCVDTDCATCSRNKQRADVDGCCGKYFIFVYNNIRIPIVDPNAPPAKDTCCRTDVADPVTGDISSVCYCESATTDCFATTTAAPTTPSPLCPASARISGRIIGGTAVEPCQPGIVSFATDSNVLCNAIYANNPTAKDSNGASLLKPVIYVPVTCTAGIDLFTTGEINLPVTVTVGNTSFLYEKDNVTRQPLNNTFFEAMTLNTYDGPCLDPVCTYNPETMSGAIDKSDCYLLSFGADSVAASSGPVTSGNLNKLRVQHVGDQCKDGMGNTAECFIPVNLIDGAYPCQGDLGAPVFCSMKTGETVLYGALGQTTDCGPGNILLPVVPIN
ncbi:uncharacterized protein LOC143293784 [Babylonia areolata]|uniref:uncharacterized protein LOC143293784 n=1 Tax=Babylonia areolata TaxID=304850 RepID=UPI003FD62E53